MQFRPNTLLLSVILIGGLAVSANSQQSATTEPTQKVKCRELVDGCKSHNKKIALSVGSIAKEVSQSKDSNNPVTLKATLQKIEGSVRDVQTEQGELSKKLNGLDFELKAPQGSY